MAGRKLTHKDCKVGRYGEDNCAVVTCRRSGAFLGYLHHRWRHEPHAERAPQAYGVLYTGGRAVYYNRRIEALDALAGHYHYPEEP